MAWEENIEQVESRTAWVDKNKTNRRLTLKKLLRKTKMIKSRRERWREGGRERESWRESWRERARELEERERQTERERERDREREREECKEKKCSMIFLHLFRMRVGWY